MFKKLIMTVMAATITLMSCSSQTRILKDLPTGDGVTKLVIGPGMMKLAETYVPAAGGGAYGDMFKDIKSVEIYSCENEKIAKEAQVIFLKALEGMKNIEQTVASEEDGEISNIYTMMDEAGTPTGMIIYSSNVADGELDIVIMTGVLKLDKPNK